MAAALFSVSHICTVGLQRQTAAAATSATLILATLMLHATCRYLYCSTRIRVCCHLNIHIYIILTLARVWGGHSASLLSLLRSADRLAK